MLQEVFSIAGKVVDIEMVRDDDGKSKGYGFIGELNVLNLFAIKIILTIFCFQ